MVLHLNKAIGIYMPSRLYYTEKSDRLFANDLYKTLATLGFTPVWINIPTLKLASKEDAQTFVVKNNLAAIVQHDSHHYSNNEAYTKTIHLLEPFVPFLNSLESHSVGHNKLTTKEVLRRKGIPVLPEVVVGSLAELDAHMRPGEIYVVKPPNQGAGRGVKLIKKEENRFSHFANGKWRYLEVTERPTNTGVGVTMQRSVLPVFDDAAYTYKDIMIEPFFNDGVEEFSSVRCTVVGDKVIEAVRRVNRANITSNVSSGGVASVIELTQQQADMAVAAAQAVGADYAGVDILVCDGKSVIGEVNIGPFTLFSACTGVRVGKLLAAHIAEKYKE